MCSFDVNRNGIVGTIVSGQMLFIGATLIAHEVERADLGLLDRVLLAAELAHRVDLDRVLAAGLLLDVSLMNFTAITVG